MFPRDPRRCVPLALVGLLCAAARADDIQFNQDVRPILAANCLACHGPDPGSRKAGLRLDREESALAPARSGKPVIDRQSPDASPLLERILSKDPSHRMPPPESNKSLGPAEQETLVRWVHAGARFEEHWAFLPPRRTAVPPGPHANPVDAFLARRLEASGLSLAPPAERTALIRRASFILRGLPPAPGEVEAFLADEAPGAWERAIDRLLASPSYGEERARRWLDVARYADTQGLHHDDFREVWPYRDWVIQAFNENLPFDQFSIEQLAGDLLPGAKDSQLVATGYLRSNVSTAEGGVIPEEVAANVAKDRIEAFGLGWLGLTVQCSQCHDHKFDPVSSKDFYQLAAMFRNGEDTPVEPAHEARVEPTHPVPSPADRLVLEGLRADIARLAGRVDAAEQKVAAVPGALEEKARALLGAAEAEARSVPPLFTGGAAFLEGGQASGSFSVTETPEGPALQASGEASLALRAEAGRFDGRQPFAIRVRARLPKDPDGALLSRMEPGKDFRGWDLLVEQGGRLALHFVAKWPDDAIKVVTRDKLPVETWFTLEALYDGRGEAAGVSFWLDGKRLELKTEKPRLVTAPVYGGPLNLGTRGPGAVLRDYAVREVHLAEGAPASARARQLLLASALREPVAGSGREAGLARAYLEATDSEYRETVEALTRARRAEAEILLRVPRTRIMREKPGKATAHILRRGQYDLPGDEVEANVPHVFPGLPEGAPNNRLGLARWLFRADHPLTARVLANRLWQDVFGTGLVATSWDFGVMGEAPSHPELLDWLAVELREDGWDVKRFLRLLLTSEAFCQDARGLPGSREKDPGNRLLSRGPRYRLDGETLRDLALAASGLLVWQIGGPPVRPYQPPNVWEAVAMLDSTTRVYAEDSGPALYRRSLYTFVKRAAHHPAMEAFNAPSREVCTIRRERSNTPLQALVLWNDPQLVEAARRLAEEAMTGAATTPERLDFIARRLLARPLRGEERAVAAASAAELVAHYRTRPDEARRLIAIGRTPAGEKLDARELAAWTLVASQILSLDATINL